MPHFSYTKGNPWPTLYAPTPADLGDLDAKTFKSIDGDEGGTWSPSAPIIIGGSGLQCPNGATWTVLTGGTLTVDGTLSLVSATLNLDPMSGITQYGNTIFETGALVVWHSGATSNWLSGSLSDFKSGATAHFENGSTLQIDNGCSFLLNGAMTLSGTGAISATGAGTGWLFTNGNGIAIQDGTNPTFASTRTRSIVQPMLAQANGFSAAFGASLNDNAAGTPGNTTYLPLTKLINGARWNALSIKYTVSSSHTPTTAASVTLVQVDTLANVVPYLTVNALTGVSGNQTLTMSLTGLSAFVDDSNYTYYLKVVAEGGTGVQSITWYTPKVTLDTITFLGQF